MPHPDDGLPVRPSDLRRDIDDELRHHLDQATADLVQAGHSPDDARAEASARLGDVDRLRRTLFTIDHRSVVRARVARAFREFTADVAFAGRRLRRRPALLLVTVLTLALGIGTALTFLGAADAILLRPLPIANPDEVVTVWRTPRGAVEPRVGMAPGTVMDIADESQSFSALAAAQPYSFQIERDGSVLSIGTWLITNGFFEVLRVRPFLGRLATAADFDAGAELSVVVSHAYWVTYLGGDSLAVGRYERLNGTPHRIAGVLPPDFPYAEGRDFYRPLRLTPAARESRLADYWSVYGRLRPGATAAAAQAELIGLAQRSDARITGESPPRGIAVISLHDALLGDVRGGLLLLALAGGLVLLMTVVNTSSLLLADAMGRARELALRASVGAGRARILRQLGTESLALALAAGVVGVGIGHVGLATFRMWAPVSMPRVGELGIDARIVLIAVLLTLAIAALVALLPARVATSTDLHRTLKAAADGSVGKHGVRVRVALVGAQVALAVVLTASGGLLLRSWLAVTRTEQGYVASGVSGMEQHVWQRYATPAAREAFARELTERLAAMPGVEAAAVASSLPLAPGIGEDDAGLRRDASAPTHSVRAVVASPGLFDALRIGPVRGRVFGDQDGASAEPVVVLSAGAARLAFGDADPIGQYVETASSLGLIRRRVIGVAPDVRFVSPEASAEPTVYVPHAQAPTGSLYVVTRHAGSVRAALPAVHAAVRDVLPDAPVNEFVVLDELMRVVSTPRRFSVLLLVSFATVALALTAVGLFGLLAQLVRLRERELGIRLAVGAWPAQIQRMVLVNGLRIAGAGALAGLVVFALGAGVLRALVYGTATRDPLSLSATLVLVLATAGLAAWWPARQATRVDPIRVLRAD